MQDTLLDFRPDPTPRETPLPLRLVGDDERLSGAVKAGSRNGIDHTFVINKQSNESNELNFAAILEHEKSNRKMRVSTT